MATAESRQPSRWGAHVLEGHLPGGSSFPDCVPGLIDQLALRLRIPREQMDGSLDSLEVVDATLRRMEDAEGIAPDDPDLIAPVVAYVGEVLRKAVDGEWEMVFDKEHQVWEPYIVDKRGRRYNPWLEPCKALLEDGLLFSAAWIELQQMY
ncbi:MAG: hypothetical protein HY320_13000 [Armatimonadetes bacterium]|nr:hypothetical protein [Armatimonadota bacterium]